MSEHESGHDDDQRKPDRSVLGDDVAHPFDQTNGIVEGLDGNADDPAEVEQRQEDREDPRILNPLVDRPEEAPDADSEDPTRP